MPALPPASFRVHGARYQRVYVETVRENHPLRLHRLQRLRSGRTAEKPATSRSIHVEPFNKLRTGYAAAQSKHRRIGRGSYAPIWSRHATTEFRRYAT